MKLIALATESAYISSVLISLITIALSKSRGLLKGEMPALAEELKKQTWDLKVGITIFPVKEKMVRVQSVHGEGFRGIRYSELLMAFGFGQNRLAGWTSCTDKNKYYTGLQGKRSK